MPSAAYLTIRTAILEKQQIVATYRGYRREMCPHAIGAKDGREKALFYQFGGGSKTGLGVPADNWRCVFVDLLTDVTSRSGQWHTATNHSQPNTCIDEIDVEVSH